MASYLHETYPNNAYFHRFYARLLYQTGRYQQAAQESKIIMQRVDSLYQGYESNTARYASFYLGHINELKYQYDEAIRNFKLTIEHSEKIGATDKGYYFHSYLHLGRIKEKNGEVEEAITYYKKVRKVSKRKHPANKQARAALKRLR